MNLPDMERPEADASGLLPVFSFSQISRVPQQDLRLFLAYVGHHYDFSRKCGLEDYSTSRIELGFMYRIKCF